MIAALVSNNVSMNSIDFNGGAYPLSKTSPSYALMHDAHHFSLRTDWQRPIVPFRVARTSLRTIFSAVCVKKVLYEADQLIRPPT